MAKKVIALGAGHGRNTAGKRMPQGLASKAMREWELNERVVRYIIEEMENYEGYEIVRLDDPSGKTDVPLRDRTNKANEANADILVSVHHNAGANRTNAGGLQVYAFNGSLQSNTLRYQRLLYDKLLANGGIRGNRATTLPRANFHMLRESNMSALLPELGFMDSNRDAHIIIKDSFAREQAIGFAKFFAEIFDLKKKDIETKPRKGKVISNTLRVRQSPTTRGKIVRELKRGDIITIIGDAGSDRFPWLKLEDGYVSNARGEYVDEIETGFKEYTIQRGDTLRGIAKKFDVEMKKLVDANGIANPNRIVTGRVLIIPTKERLYKVKPGDSLSRIANKFDTTVDKIVEDNNISNRHLIHVGQILKV